MNDKIGVHVIYIIYISSNLYTCIQIYKLVIVVFFVLYNYFLMLLLKKIIISLVSSTCK